MIRLRKRLSFFLATVAAATGCAWAQVSARSALTTIPAPMVAAVSEGVLLDLLDYAENGIEKEIEEQAKMSLSMPTPDHAVLGIGDVRTLEVIVLPYKSGEYIFTIDRVATPANDAALSIFDSRWQSLDLNRFLSYPTMADWTVKLPAAEVREVEERLPFLCIDARYDDATSTLTLTPVLDDYISIENMEYIRPRMRQSLSYHWDGKKFRPDPSNKQ